MSYTRNRNSNLVVILLAVVILGGVLAALTAANISQVAIASAQEQIASVYSICEEYTKRGNLQNDESKTIIQYESYIDERFEIGNMNAAEGITDEWIFQIVPKAVFDMQPDDFLYIGIEYGFYVDYDNADDSYLVYLMLHTYDNESTSGHIVRKIEPLYYERYKYDSVTGTAALEYVHDEGMTTDEDGTIVRDDRYYYKKCSDYENIYLKDIEFGGTLYNENHRNQGEEGYVDAADRGGYFIGGSYKFKGVSTDSHEFDFIADVFSTMIGWIDFSGEVGDIVDAIGYAVDIAELVASGVEWGSLQKSDFRDTITNENDYTFRMVDIAAPDQIDKYGHLLKNFVTTMETPDTADGLLYMTDNGNYAQSTFYCSYADDNDRWNTGFAGTVRMDIVKGNGNIIGDTVTALAEDVESNSFRGEVYDDEDIAVRFNETTELYTSPNGAVPLSFTAPVNGDYTFETSGDAQNEFSAAKGTVTAVGNNSKLVVRLEQGEVFNFTSQSFEDKRAIYTLSAKFTPEQLGFGEETTLEIAPGETEYFVFSSDNPQVIEWSVLSECPIGIAVTYESFTNFIINYETDVSPVGMMFTEQNGLYFFAIKNVTEQVAEVTAKLNEITDVGLNEEITKEGNFDQILRFSPQYSSNYEITLTSDIAIFGEIRSSDFGLISQKSGTGSVFSVMMEGGRDYYIVMRHTVDTETHCSITPIAQVIGFGENELGKVYNTMLYRLRSFDTDVRLNITCSGENSFYLYDESMQLVEKTALLSAGEKYYIGVSGDANSYALDLIPVAAGETGTIGSDGFVLIPFVAQRDGQYNVTEWDDYDWFTEQLQSLSNNFNKGDTYYLKLNGVPGSNYSIVIEFNAPIISVYEYENLTNNYYKFTADSTDTYIYKARCSVAAIVTLNIYDSEHKQVMSVADATQEGVLQLNAGTYYFEISISGASQTTFYILPQNGEAPLTRSMVEGEEVAVMANANTVNVFTVTAPKNAEYYLKLYNAATNVEFDVSVYFNGEKLQTNRVAYTDRGIESVAEKMNLSAGQEYTIYVDCYQGAEESYNLLMYVPSRIEEIKFNDTVVYSNGIQTGSLDVAMGSTGTFAVIYNEAATFNEIDGVVDSDIIVNSIVCLENGNLEIGFDVEAENKLLRIKFFANLNEANLDFTLKYPYYAESVIDENYSYIINTTITPGADTEQQVPKTVTLYINGVEHEYMNTAKIDMIQYPIFENMPIGCSVVYQFKGYEYELELDELTYSVNTIEVTGNIEFNSPRVVINYLGSGITIKIQSNVKAVFINLSGNTTSKNTKIDILQNASIYLYINNVVINSEKESNGTGLSAVINSLATEMIICVQGNNTISGYASEALIKAINVEFEGDGELTVEGCDGDDGANALSAEPDDRQDGKDGGDGYDGGNGITAMICEYGSVSGNATVKLRGGNGGDGGDGADGTSGKAGKAQYGGYGVSNQTPSGNGGDGGNGGNGGNAGLGCNVSVTGATVINGNAGIGGNGGNGGDGGNGANGSIYRYGAPDGGTMYSAVEGTPGGNGGNGGNSGANGVGNVSYGGDKGNGGTGGKGGNGGNGTSAIWSYQLAKQYVYSNAQNGGNGGNGGSGAYSGGAGGNGGKGGNGAKGRDGSLFYECEAGKPGGNGGNGGNGGVTYGPFKFTVAGGEGGEGGAGGAAGDAVLDKNKKGPGANGAKGANGSPGAYEGEPACVAAGTLITLADGRQVPVESLTGNELLLVWNLFTGKFDVAPILFIDSEAAGIYEVITLTFSDGTTLKVIDEHALWDFDLNEYVFMRSDAAKYIGHWFNKQTYDSDGNMIYTRVQLVGVTVTEEYTSAWSPVTYGHLCFYVNGMLSMPGATTGLINIFEVDPDTMTIDEEQYLADIETYGLFTYEEFAALYPVPEEIFDAFGGQYLKVAMGKGLLTEDMISILINRYSEFFV